MPQTALLLPDSPAHGVVIELMPQAVITGKVVDENGDPAMGMFVVPYIARVMEGKRELRTSSQAMTNDLGEFRLAPLEPGRYIVCAQSSPGHQEFQDACYPAPVESGAPAAMRIGPGQETHVEFTVSRAHHVKVSGTLTGLPPGTPVAL